jgi:glycosyltransferase involved in cell wall biosynthesis
VKIGIDVTGLYIVKAGIYYYSVNLLQNVLALDNEHEFVLLDYAPVRGKRVLPFDFRALSSDRVRVVEIDGPRHRKLIDWKRLDFFGGRFSAQCVDALLDRPWRWYIAKVTLQELNAALEALDVVHVSDVNSFRPVATPMVSTVYDLSPLLFPEWHTSENRGRFKRKAQLIQEHAQAVIAISQHTKRDLVTLLGVADERIHVVYGAADVRYHPLSERAQVDRVIQKYGLPERDYILYVGTLEPRKNLVRLIEAYGAALARYGETFPPLVLVGGKGWFYEDIFRSVERLGLEQRVIFTGFVDDDDMPALFNGALIFVYPSLYEGFGMPVLEAMACGVPVIASNASSLPEVVGEAGIMVDPMDTDALAAALVALVEDADRRDALRAAGLMKATDFSWERAARETLTVYESVYSDRH